MFELALTGVMIETWKWLGFSSQSQRVAVEILLGDAVHDCYRRLQMLHGQTHETPNNRWNNIIHLRG